MVICLLCVSSLEKARMLTNFTNSLDREQASLNLSLFLPLNLSLYFSLSLLAYIRKVAVWHVLVYNSSFRQFIQTEAVLDHRILCIGRRIVFYCNSFFFIILYSDSFRCNFCMCVQCRYSTIVLQKSVRCPHYSKCLVRGNLIVVL